MEQCSILMKFEGRSRDLERIAVKFTGGKHPFQTVLNLKAEINVLSYVHIFKYTNHQLKRVFCTRNYLYYKEAQLQVDPVRHNPTCVQI